MLTAEGEGREGEACGGARPEAAPLCLLVAGGRGVGVDWAIELLSAVLKGSW